ncbi:protein CURVATURE THYLAKOID 1B, chloroplastic-like [Macadamia integrifolia]|uniref:protein CURVATURE THYLAKOID 1B, chloroplastic-like n=1 Tax=Macadamia integrifolia TaxID=60698 RepID=UPI001C52E51D|nr:protein CURVATURE THYLAKOID 1B, chloroplastic-like [Macadamia integrifolia]
MASTSTNVSISSSSTLIDGKAPRRSAAASPQCVSLPTLPPSSLAVPSQNLPQSARDTGKTTAYCRKIARNVVAMATGETSAEVAAAELPEILNSIQEAWDKLEDKYAVTSLAFAGAVALWGSTGMISAIDRLPLVPSVMELVGIGYTGWFAYKNLIFKPDRESLIKKIKDTFKDIIGSS